MRSMQEMWDRICDSGQEWDAAMAPALNRVITERLKVLRETPGKNPVIERLGLVAAMLRLVDDVAASASPPIPTEAVVVLYRLVIDANAQDGPPAGEA